MKKIDGKITFGQSICPIMYLMQHALGCLWG